MADENLQKPDSKQYYKNVPGFRVSSGFEVTKGDLKGETIDYALVTDEIQGQAFYKSGLHKLVCNGTSYETVGLRTKEGDRAKVIAAKYGHIHIDAQAGDIVLKGRNVRIQATEEVTVIANNQFSVLSPIQNLSGETVNVLATGTLSMGGNFIKNHAGVEINLGTQSDAKQGGFLGMILQLGERFKDFL